MTMQITEGDKKKNCTWAGKFNESQIQILADANLCAGIMVILFGFSLSFAIIFSKFVNNDSYRNLANYILTAALRRAMYVLQAMPFLKIINDLNMNELEESCEMFAFWETFLAVLEMETLTHVCIERYVTTRDKAMGLQPKNYNILYFFISLVFAAVYSYPALMGFGSYGKDFPCSYCTYDMVLPKGWLKYFVLTVFFARSIKPVMFMVIMLYWAKKIEKSLKNNEEHSKLTKGVIFLVLINILCWAPITFFRASVLKNQLIYGVVQVQANVTIIMFALFVHWLAPALGMVGLVVVDAKLRSKVGEFIRGIKAFSKAPEPLPVVAKPEKSE